MDMSEIIFEDSEFEMQDADDVLFHECAQELMDNTNAQPLNLSSVCENGPTTSHETFDDIEISSSIFNDDNIFEDPEFNFKSILDPDSNNRPNMSQEISNSIKYVSPKLNEENRPSTSHDIPNSIKIWPPNSDAEKYMQEVIQIPLNLSTGYEDRPSSTSHEIVNSKKDWPPKLNPEVVEESLQMLGNNQILCTPRSDIGLAELSHMFDDENPFSSQLDCGNVVKKLEAAPLHIDALPDEILVKILSYLSHNELCRAARVSRKWNECARCPLLWKKVDVRFFSFSDSQHEQAINIVKRLPPYATHLKLDFGAHQGPEEQLNFFCFSSTLNYRCPRLETLILFHADLSSNLASIISLCSRFLRSLKVLILKHCTLEYYFSSDTNFAACTIEVLDLCGCQGVFFDIFMFSKLPKLKKLYLSDTDVLDYTYEYFYTCFFDNLQVLDMGSMGIDFMIFEAIKYRGLRLTELYLCDAFLEDSHLKIYGSQFPCLQTLCLRRCTSISCMSIVFLVHSLPSLQNLYVDAEMAESLPSLEKCRLGIVKTINSCDIHQQVDYFCE